MGVAEKLKIFVVQEPVVAASCLIAGFDDDTEYRISTNLDRKAINGLFLPAFVRPILDSFESAKQVPQPDLKDVVAGMTGKKRE